MDREVYLQQRGDMMTLADQLIGEGKIEEANGKIEEIKNLDGDFDVACKAKANLEALNRESHIYQMANFSGGAVAERIIDGAGVAAKEDIYNSLDYRQAFMNYVVGGMELPVKFKNTDETTKTGDIGAVIPTTIMERIVEKLENNGKILQKVTRTAYKGGLSVPTSTVKPVATWVAEGGTSDKQKKTTGSITFSYYKLRCAVSVSLETDTVALPIFETALVNNVAEAMVKALEEAIVAGDGNNKPTGILKDGAPEGQNIDIAAGKTITYTDLTEAEGRLPEAYEAKTVWCMAKRTFAKISGMVDSTGQPICRVNYGLAGKFERSILGREVIVFDKLPALSDTVTTDTVVAFMFNFEDYVLNTNYNVTVKQYEDNDTEDKITKAIMLVDGKPVDKNSLVTLTKKA